MQISRAVVDALIHHARAEAPRECCGLLVGSESLIDESVSTPNLEAGFTRYQVDPQTHVALVRRLRGGRRSIVGAYHSHPCSAAVPSETDLAEAFYPDFVYVIVSLANPAKPEVRGYRIHAGRADHVALEVVETA
jgi:proteasome lid subunit RPN8/RPN11